MSRSKAGEALEVKTDAAKSCFVAEVGDGLNLVHLAKQIDGVGLCIVLNVEGPWLGSLHT